MPAPVTSEVVRDLLKKYPTLDINEMVSRAKARGVASPDKSIQTTIYNEKKKIREAEKFAPAAARTTAPRSSVPAPATMLTSPKPTASAVPVVSGLAGVFANVAQVNKVVDLSGGVENARAVADAVNTCGGVDAFLQHLDLVAGIRSDKTA